MKQIDAYIHIFWRAYLHTVHYLGLTKLGRIVPVKHLIVPHNQTTREHYRAERDNYRLSHALVNRGDVLSKRGYAFYSIIARKYGWKYIKEIYDNSE